jgi:ferredoxin--NADP+ reductase
VEHVHDLVIAGSGPTALSVAADAAGRGAEKVVVLAPGDSVTPFSSIGRFDIDVRFHQPVERAETLSDGRVVVESGTDSFVAWAAVIVGSSSGAPPPFPVADGCADRVHATGDEFDARDLDVLVVGTGDRIVEETLRLLDEGGRVVVAFEGSFSDLSHLAQDTLVGLEHDRLVTVFWQSRPDEVQSVDGFPLVYFTDRRTPDIQVDHLVYVGSTGIEEAGDGPIYRVDDLAPGSHRTGPSSVWETIVSELGDTLELSRPHAVRRAPGREEAALRQEHYNATITYFDHSHEDLWVLRVRPDQREVSHLAGQYATLGLGYWEPRADDSDDVTSEARRTSMVRRSYSISSRIFDDHGYLVDPSAEEEIEFYIVHVRPDGDNVPALTPRLALKRTGDRIYLGPRIIGRYTLGAVTDPSLDVVFLSTGTGEAPHNAMIAELFRKGHYGGIASVVTVRYRKDLGYEDVHRRLESRYPKYRYLTLPTREEDIPKRYIQDVVASGELGAMLPNGLDPARTHVYLCGNPAMIGLPEWDGDEPRFPERKGVVELLHGRGFRIDRRGSSGNVHYEEYW